MMEVMTEGAMGGGLEFAIGVVIVAVVILYMIWQNKGGE